MKEISLNILDITENSVKAGSLLTEILITENKDTLSFTVTDNGCGMTAETLNAVTNPFYTTRTTRKVGLGIPLLKLACEQTGGNLVITSRHISEHPDNHGTQLKATFFKNHLDYPPLGDIISTVTTLIQGHPHVDFLFKHTFNGSEVALDTRELRTVLEDVPLSTFEVLQWISENLKEQYKILNKINITIPGFAQWMLT